MLRVAAIGRYFRRPEGRDLAMVLKLWLITAVMVLIGLILLARTAWATPLQLATRLDMTAATAGPRVPAAASAPASLTRMPLSQGDRVTVLVQEGTEFSGKYQVSVGGEITLPYLRAVRVEGLEPEQAGRTIAAALVDAGIFQPGRCRVSIQVLEWAPVEVSIQGAVFYPGRHRINLPPARDRAPEKTEEAPGGRPHERYLSDALRAAGGITPEADVRRIQVTRQGATTSHDLSGFFDGRPAEDIALRAEDTVYVPSSGGFDPVIARPSRITPPGIKVFASNLTLPANNNNASTVTGGAISLAYGTRLSQAAVAANCSGGTRATSASRAVALIRTDRLSGKTTTLENSIEDMLDTTRTDVNPLLLEGDSVVCYDSTVTNIRDIFRTLGDILVPWRGILTR